MKTIFRVALITAGLALAPTLASADWQYQQHHPDNTWLNARNQHQDHRIYQGYQNGSLTPWEAKRLKHRDRRLERATHYAMRDGHLSPREWRYLNNAYDRQSRVIYRYKHDDCDRQ